MGAGDAVASVLALVRMWDLKAVMRKYANKKRHPVADDFFETAAIVFVSLLSRYAGNVVYHSNRCDWLSVPQEAFPRILKSVAEKSLDAATALWGRTLPQVTRETEWDIDVALWHL